MKEEILDYHGVLGLFRVTIVYNLMIILKKPNK